MVWPRWVCIGVPFSFDNLLKVDLLLFLFRPPVVPWKGARLSSASSLLYCARRRQSRPGSRQPASRSAGPSVVAADIGYRVQKRRCQRQFPMALLQGSLFLACARARAPRPLGKASRACMARPPPKKGSKKPNTYGKKKDLPEPTKFFSPGSLRTTVALRVCPLAGYFFRGPACAPLCRAQTFAKKTSEKQ